MATGKKSNRGKDSKGGEVSVVLNASDDVVPYYVNVIEVSHSTHEFTMSCGRASSKLPASQLDFARETGELHVDVGIQLMFAPTLLPSLIRILIDQQAKYEKEVGPINKLADAR